MNTATEELFAALRQLHQLDIRGYSSSQAYDTNSDLGDVLAELEILKHKARRDDTLRSLSHGCDWVARECSNYDADRLYQTPRHVLLAGGFAALALLHAVDSNTTEHTSSPLAEPSPQTNPQ